MQPTIFAYGIIPFRQLTEETEFLVVLQNGEGEKFWSFPKGHPEKGEIPEETARRELEEETGIQEVTVLPFSTSLTYVSRGTQKQVTYFLGEVMDEPRGIPNDEVTDYQWVRARQAEELLTYENTREVLRRAEHYLLG